MWSLGTHGKLSPVTFNDQSMISAHYDMAYYQGTASSRPEHPDAKHPCAVCGRKFTEARSMRLHMRTVHGVGDVKTYKCDVCLKIFKRKDVLKRHLSLVHGLGDILTFQCQLCSKVCSEKGNLTQHMAYVHGVRENMFYCDVCSDVFKRKAI